MYCAGRVWFACGVCGLLVVVGVCVLVVVVCCLWCVWFASGGRRCVCWLSCGVSVVCLWW